ncbi:MAG: SH3 domain-containing protein [Alphaproteobacteria bacterium]|nr:SH3 domain-containing protein [Alphaproteobacteria bacterium]
MSKKTCTFLAFFAFLTLFCADLRAQEADPFRSTSYPLPRFVSVGSEEVFVRTGPGKQYPVKWELRQRGLPVEIILEFDNWRKIRDHEGGEGWVHSSLLSGRRTAFVVADSLIDLRLKAKQDARVIAKLEPGTLLNVDECDGIWCKVKVAGYKGWIRQPRLWGVYENEVF